MLSDAMQYFHGTVTSAFGPVTNTAGVLGDALCAAGSQYCNLEIDFGAPSTGSAFPYISEFPSLTEKGYASPPEVVGEGGIEMGVHIVIGSAFNTLTSILFNVVSAATTAATTPIIAARSLTLAQMAVVGAHYWIPVPLTAVLEFLRWDAVLTGSDPTLGTLYSWWGPKCGGEQ
jgi:hypothetical protein